MKNEKIAMPLLGVLLWVISISTFTAATLLPRPITGLAKSLNFEQENEFIPENEIKINEKDLNRSILFGNGVVNRMHRLETNLGWSNIHLKKGTPSHGQFIVNSPEKEALRQGKEALIATKATIHLMNTFCHKHNLTPTECSKYVTSYSLYSTPLENSCKKLHKSCSSEEIFSKYRSIDGTCNHLTDGSRGAAFTGYKRLLFPEYLDGVHEVRRAADKKSLPSARLVSTSLVKHVKQDSDLTLAVMQWSQFVEHDLSHTAISKMVHTENTIECCAPSGSALSPRYIHPFCAQISIPADDDYYSQLGLDCMSYVRSLPALRSDCNFGPVDQQNQATHYLDGSHIYGSTEERSLQLRSFINGQLMENHGYLPTNPNIDDCDPKAKLCFLSGDSRVNIHPQLTAMHTLWLREHNRIARELASLNPHWDDEMLYQEARRIVVAELQQITYNEWIPVVLGKKYVHKIQKYNKYSETVNPSISNSFASAALRVVNSLMDDQLKMFKENRNINTTLNLRNYFNKPEIITGNGYFDAILRGLATQKSMDLDFIFVDDIAKYLFTDGNFGFDVFSLDIQRGRDHGLPSYVAFRTLCGLPKIETFDDLLDVIPPETVDSLGQIYGSPMDIDLIIGGISEKADGDSLFGPTFSCLVADQFLRTRRGDRYFFTNEKQPKPFSHSQMRGLEQVTLARVFCDNSNDVQKMQPRVFNLISEINDLVDCDSDTIPRLNLKLWMDGRETYY